MAGIFDCTIAGKQTQVLYVGITMGDFEDYETFKKLVALNKKTGFMPCANITDIYNASWGRVVLLIAPALDGDMVAKYNNDNIGFIEEMLENYTLCATDRGTIHVDRLEVKDMNIKITGVSPYNMFRESDDSVAGIQNKTKLELVMEDGSTQISNVTSGFYMISQKNGMEEVQTGELEATCEFKKVIDASKVKYVKWLGQEIQVEFK